jgi:hypothetical protein
MSKTTTRKLTKAELVEMAKKEIAEKKAAKVRELSPKVSETTTPVETTPVENAKPEVKEAPKGPETPKEQKTPTVVNIDKMRGKLPARVSTKDLCTLFGYDDGGKALRKVLRAKFAVPSGHKHKADWVWKNGDKALDEILKYFAKAGKITEVVAQ